ncbi:MAG: DUF2970 domain-containing protein [Thiolinea sp.]
MEEKNQQKQVTSWTIFVSALAGLLGVQKKENLERDFQSGKFWHFFIAGAVVTVLFMLVVWLAVQVLLSSV